MIAIGEYLHTLRESLGRTRTEIATQIGTSPSQIHRIEHGEQDTRGTLLLAFNDAVDGNVEQLKSLLLDPTATQTDGRDQAKIWLQQGYRRNLLSLVASATADPHPQDEILPPAPSMDHLIQTMARIVPPEQLADNIANVLPMRELAALISRLAAALHDQQ